MKRPGSIKNRSALLPLLSLFVAVCLVFGIALIKPKAVLADETYLTEEQLSLVKAGGWLGDTEAPEGYSVTTQLCAFHEYGYDYESYNEQLHIVTRKCSVCEATDSYQEEHTFEEVGEEVTSKELVPSDPDDPDSELVEREVTVTIYKSVCSLCGYVQDDEPGQIDPDVGEDITQPEATAMAANFATAYASDENIVTISTAEAFAYFAHQVSLGAYNGFEGFTVILYSNINLSGKLWIPVGTFENPFRGTFNGNGWTVSGLSSNLFYNFVKYDTALSEYYIDCRSSISDEGEGTKIYVDSDGDELYYGLFGVTENAEFSHLSLTGVDIDTDSSTADTASVGAIVAVNNSGSFTMSDCSASGYMQIGTASEFLAVGGLAGAVYADGNSIDISNCTNNIIISVGSEYGSVYAGHVGGIVGYVQYFSFCSISDCTNNGNITCSSPLNGGENNVLSIGGIVGGWLNADETHGWSIVITGCVNSGNITGTNSLETYTGGIIGIVGGADSNGTNVASSVTIQVTANINVGNIRGGRAAGGIVGWFKATESAVQSVSNCYNNGDVYTSYYREGDDFKITVGASGGLIGRFTIYGVLQGPQPSVSGGNSGTVSGIDYERNPITSGANVGQLIGQDETVGTTRKYETTFFIDATESITVSKSEDKAPASAHNVVLSISGDGKTLLGLGENDFDVYSENFKIVVPASVEQISLGAFVNIPNLVAVEFESGSNLKEIGEWAFAGTGIGRIILPAGVTKIGMAAFANCEYLNYIELPELSGDVEYNNRLSNTTAYVIAQSVGDYNKLNGIGIANLTYRVAIEYYRKSEKLGDEIRLFGTNYNVTYNQTKDRWLPSDAVLGIEGEMVYYLWYSDENASGLPLQSVDVTLLLSGSGVETVKLYTIVNDYQFIGQSNIVFAEGRTYAFSQELNALLSAEGNYISEGMTVTLKSYLDADGKSAAAPDKVGNAGTYTLNVNYQSSDYELVIVVERATVDLDVYNNLYWNFGGTELLDYTLYLYDITGSNDKYPSTQVLTSSQIASIGTNSGITLSGTYTATYVQHSVVRNRGTQISINIVDNPTVYSVSYASTAAHSGTKVGVYTATATITATTNYLFTTSGANTLRGMNVSVSGDSKSATVEKVWYIVDISNWLEKSNGSEYSISDYTFGQSFTGLEAPRLHLGDSSAISLTLYYVSGTQRYVIGTAFTCDNFSYYINDAMPAGNYELVANVEGVTVSEIYHNAFTETIVFTVAKAKLATSGIDAILKEKDFAFTMTETTRTYLLGDAVTAQINGIIETTNSYKQPQGIWATSPYKENYYGLAELTFNLASSRTDLYYSDASIVSQTNEPMTYTVYYQLSAPNYYSSIENLASGTRHDYHFNIIMVEEVNPPTVYSKEFSGELQTSGLTDGQHYKVVSDLGGTNVQEYEVVLELTDPVHYMWRGQTLDNRTAQYVVMFAITSTSDYWEVVPSIIEWKYGAYDPDVNRILASTRYSSLVFKVSYDMEGEDLYRGLESFVLEFKQVEQTISYVVSDEIAEILNKLPAGYYFLTAMTNPGENCTKLADVVISFTVARAENYWVQTPNVKSWTTGNYSSNAIKNAAVAAYGKVQYRVVSVDDITNVLYDSAKKINNLATAGAGTYMLTAYVADGDDNYTDLAEFSILFDIFAPEGLAWWGVMLIVIGVLLIVAAVIFILWKKGVFEILTGKISLAIRTRATVDATIAAVRAARVAELSKQSIMEAERLEKLEAEQAAAKATETVSDGNAAESAKSSKATSAKKSEKTQKNDDGSSEE